VVHDIAAAVLSGTYYMLFIIHLGYYYVALNSGRDYMKRCHLDVHEPSISRPEHKVVSPNKF
jgi:hypothetical protein